MQLTQFSPQAPLLLLTEYHPYTPGGGLVILRSLIEPEDRDRIIWVTCAPPRDIDPSYPDVISLKRGTVGRGWPERVAPLLDSTLLARGMAKEILTIAKARNAKAIWSVAHASEVPITAALMRIGSLPIHVTVHDDPAYAVAAMSKKLRPLVKRFDRQLGEILRGARTIDVIGEGMRKRYRERFGVESEIVHRALDAVTAPSPRYDRAARGLAIAVLGTTYRYDQLPILAEAVALAAKQIGALGKIIVYGEGFGGRLRDECAGKIEVEVRGHVKEPQAAQQLATDAFALYLNYPFTDGEKVLRETSFPTKLSTYTMAARPVLVHAPAGSSVDSLAHDFPDFAVRWKDLDPASGARALVDLWNRPDAEHSHHAAADAVRERFYNPARNRQTIARLLNGLVG